MRLCASFILSNKIVSSNYKWINPTIIVSSKRGWNGIETTRGLINAIPYIRPRSRSSRIDFDNFVRVWRINVFLAIYRQPGLNVRKSRNRKYESNFKIVHPRGIVIVKLAYFRCASIHRARNSRDIFEDGLIY